MMVGEKGGNDGEDGSVSSAANDERRKLDEGRCDRLDESVLIYTHLASRKRRHASRARKGVRARPTTASGSGISLFGLEASALGGRFLPWRPITLRVPR